MKLVLEESMKLVLDKISHLGSPDLKLCINDEHELNAAHTSLRERENNNRGDVSAYHIYM